MPNVKFTECAEFDLMKKFQETGDCDCKFCQKDPQVHLIIIREWLKTLPPV